MTEPTPELEDAAAEPDDDTDLPQDIEAARRLRAENKALRARAKAAEEAHEADLARIANLEWAQIREYAGDVLHDPSDLINAQPDTAEFYDDADAFSGITRSGVVDAAKALAKDKPWLLKPQTAVAPPTDRPLESLRSGAMPEDKPPTPTWASALRGGA